MNLWQLYLIPYGLIALGATGLLALWIARRVKR